MASYPGYLRFCCLDAVEQIFVLPLSTFAVIYVYNMSSANSCPSLTGPNNGTMNCSLGDDGIPTYEDTCNFTCNTGYELTGSDSRICQSDGSWSGNETMCRRGMVFMC